MDRTSCPWLIRRFIDPQAEFVFVEPTADVATLDGQTFEMCGAEYSHEGDQCTFQVTVKRHALDTDPALVELGRIIRDGTARIWDVSRGASTLTLFSHRTLVGATFSPDGQRVATGDRDGLVQLWDAGTGREVLELTGAAVGEGLIASHSVLKADIWQYVEIRQCACT